MFSIHASNAMKKRPCIRIFPVTGPVSVTSTCLLIQFAGWTARATSSRRVVAEIALLIPRLEHLAVLNDHAHLAIEADLRKQTKHGRGKHLRITHLAAKFSETAVFSMRHIAHSALLFSPRNKPVIGWF